MWPIEVIKDYRKYEIPKKRGGKRIIFHPSPKLKVFQYWLVNRLFVYFPISSYATAYKKGCSIKNNATLHLNKAHLLHLDIIDFFPSITRKHIEQVINNNKFILKEKIGFELTGDDIKIILKLTLLDDSLTIGSISSPILSNIVMFDIDNELNKVAESYDCKYSRYADDMVFSSTKFIPHKIIDDVDKILKSNGFLLNKKKSYFMGKGSRKVVTGINVNKSRLTIGRKKRDEIKKMIYMKCKYNIGDNKKILGYLSYLKDIDPWYFNRIIIKYNKIYEMLKINP